MFIVPDDMLEELTCDFCHKYLSVGPVNVVSKRRKKCGRCALRNDETEVTSVYRHFGEYAIFKCINRFDGCEEWLNYGEALNHEKKCLSNKYVCPLCEYDREMETYQLLYHFKKQHYQNYLKKSTLWKKLDEIQTVEKFLYLKDNCIFLIFIEFQKYPGTLSFNAFHIGGKNEAYDIQQKCYVHIDGLKIYETGQTQCFSWQNNIDWRMDSKKIENLQNECNLGINFEFSIPVKVGNQIIDKNRMALTQLKTAITASKNMRSIYVDKENEKEVNKSNWSISPCGKKLLLMTFDGDIEVKVDCKICSQVSISNEFMTNNGASRQLICNSCCYFEVTSIIKLTDLLKPTDMEKFYIYFNYSCIWNCGGIYNWICISTHELHCKKSPQIKCPYKNCSFNNFFCDMVCHLLDDHGDIFCWKKIKFTFEESTRPYIIQVTKKSTVQYYVFTHRHVLMTFRWTYSVGIFQIEVKCANKTENTGNIKMQILSAGNPNKYKQTFVNKSDQISTSVFPIFVYFIID